MKNYLELIENNTFEDRLDYLRLDNEVFKPTFGLLRRENQFFYKTSEWRRVRLEVIARDLGLDLGIFGKEIFGLIYVHHIEPLTPKILRRIPELALDPNNLITVSNSTHRHIHYGTEITTDSDILITRRPGDTKLW
jgi:hypothetical protein